MTAASRPNATWQCPHCGARQPESGRCWVCHRPSTCCATCASFRPSLVAGIGYCALDRTRSPLRGTEMRGCWQAATRGVVTLFDRPLEPAGASDVPVRPVAPPPPSPTPGEATAGRRPLEWVPVDEPTVDGPGGSTAA